MANIIFEQPLNEHIRVCLRLEHVFAMFDTYINGTDELSYRNAMHTVQQIINVVDRPDIKSKLSQALIQQATKLSKIEKQPNINREKLRDILDDLDCLIDYLQSTHGRIGQNLRSNEFLTTIRQHQGNPGGACNFSTPAYFL